MDQIMKNIDTELPIYVLVRGRLPTRPSLGEFGRERIFDEAISSRQRYLASSSFPP